MATLTHEQRLQARQQLRQAWLRKTLSHSLTYGVMIFLACLALFPIIFMIVAAFKPNSRVIADLDSLKAFLPNPGELTLDNVKNVFARVPFGHLAFNSLFITALTVSVGLFVNSMTAYALARMQWLGRNVVRGGVISLVIIPLEAIAVPLMMQVNQMSAWVNVVLLVVLGGLTVMLWVILWEGLDQAVYELGLGSILPRLVQGVLRAALTLALAAPLEILVYDLARQTQAGGSWLNSYHVQILPFIPDPFSIFLFYQFFISLPRDFDEAAVVDGAGYFRIYWQLVVPLSRPVFATVAILKALQFWGFYLWPLMVTRGDQYQPLMVGLGYFQTQAPILWGSIMAYAAMVTIPVLILFLLFQRWFIQSVSSSGIKG
jgi:multiple sugar transport system permease protein